MAFLAVFVRHHHYPAPPESHAIFNHSRANKKLGQSWKYHRHFFSTRIKRRDSRELQPLITMKLFALFTVALAQEGAPGDGSRAMSLDKKISNAKVKCNYYMEKALVCNPPSSKISKYNHRIEKVLLDAKFHLESGKCDKNAPAPGPYSRRRRQAGDDLFSATILSV